ncbi:hypothetical protein ONZ45_g17358 [Pleurotus djamor]|nr:hypothetical protein ONZ45_g17358 [Pleurotus djamor]
MIVDEVGDEDENAGDVTVRCIPTFNDDAPYEDFQEQLDQVDEQDSPLPGLSVLPPACEAIEQHHTSQPIMRPSTPGTGDATSVTRVGEPIIRQHSEPTQSPAQRSTSPIPRRISLASVRTNSDSESILRSMTGPELLGAFSEECTSNYGSPAPQVAQFLYQFTAADPNLVDEADNNQNWGRRQWAACNPTIDALLVSWVAIGSVDVARELIAAVLNTSKAARYICHVKNISPLPSTYCCDRYVEQLLNRLRDLWQGVQKDVSHATVGAGLAAPTPKKATKGKAKAKTASQGPKAATPSTTMDPQAQEVLRAELLKLTPPQLRSLAAQKGLIVNSRCQRQTCINEIFKLPLTSQYTVEEIKRLMAAEVAQPSQKPKAKSKNASEGVPRVITSAEASSSSTTLDDTAMESPPLVVETTPMSGKQKGKSKEGLPRVITSAEALSSSASAPLDDATMDSPLTP